MDRFQPNLPERVMASERAAQSHDAPLHRSCGAVDRHGPSGWATRPVYPVQPSAVCAPNPKPNRADAATETSRRRAQAACPAHPSDKRSATSEFFSCRHPTTNKACWGRRSGSLRSPPRRPSARHFSPLAFGEWCPLGVRLMVSLRLLRDKRVGAPIRVIHCRKNFDRIIRTRACFQNGGTG